MVDEGKERAKKEPAPELVERRKNENGGRQLSPRRERGPGMAGAQSPFALLRRLSDEMDRLYEDFGFGRGSLVPASSRFWPTSLALTEPIGFGGWIPATEVVRRGDEIVVRADLPGIKKEDVKVEVTPEALKIEGERRQEKEEKEEGYYRSECSYGSFSRTIPLPEGINADEVKASFHDGVLEVCMPAPKEAEGTRRIEVQSA